MWLEAGKKCRFASRVHDKAWAKFNSSQRLVQSGPKMRRILVIFVLFGIATSKFQFFHARPARINKYYSTVAGGQQTCTATNEVYKECGSKCNEPRCGDTGGKTCPTVCDEGCFCSKGFVRDLNKNCVEPSACCPLNEHFTPCGADASCQVTCANPDSTRLSCKEICTPGWCAMPDTRGSVECANPF